MFTKAFNSEFRIQNSEFLSSLLLATLFALPALSHAADLIIHLPPNVTLKSAEALAPSSQAGDEGPILPGKSSAGTATFTNLKPATPYDLRLTLSDGRILRGVNLSWYTREPAHADAGPLNDDDQKQIQALVSDIKSFYDISRILAINGDHDRATVLVERIRSARFDGGANGEVIWRIELWYFNNDFGGWNEPPQTNKVLIRKRFTKSADYHAEVDNLHWVPQIGGITFKKQDEKREITLLSEAIPTTQPAQ
jgi:hypothetical protein